MNIFNRRVRDASGRRHHGSLIAYTDQQIWDSWTADVPSGSDLTYSLGLAGTASGQFVDVGTVASPNRMEYFRGYFKNEVSINSSTTRQALFSHATSTNESVLVFGGFTSQIAGEVITFAHPTERTAVVGITILPGWHLLELAWNTTEDRFDIILDGVTQTVITNNRHTARPLLSSVRLGRSGEPNGGYGFTGKIADFQFWSASDLLARYDFNAVPIDARGFPLSRLVN